MSRYNDLMVEINSLCREATNDLLRTDPKRGAEIFGQVAKKFGEITDILEEEESGQLQTPIE